MYTKKTTKQFRFTKDSIPDAEIYIMAFYSANIGALQYGKY